MALVLPQRLLEWVRPVGAKHILGSSPTGIGEPPVPSTLKKEPNWDRFKIRVSRTANAHGALHGGLDA